jgi:hypothetical protein
LIPTCTLEELRSRNSVLRVVTRLQAEWLRNHGSIRGTDNRFFSSQNYQNRFWGPPSFLLNKERYPFSGGIVAEGDSDHLPPSGVQVKNT